MSQVMMMPMDMLPQIEDMVIRSDHILLLESLDEKREYYRRLFPKETHYRKISSTIYIEEISAYKVLEVLKSHSVREGEKIWLWREPAYGEHLIRAEHEHGLLQSPYVSRYVSKYTVEESEKHAIYYLKDICYPKTADTYENIDYGVEGFSGIEEVKKLIANPPGRDFGIPLSAAQVD